MIEPVVGHVAGGGTPGLGLLFLHALPLDAGMWSAQADILPGSTYAPTLYGEGNDLRDWARSALGQVRERRMVVVGCSVGGSCAIEVACLAPERIAALVLIGTKAGHRPDPQLRDHVLRVLGEEGVAPAWKTFWASLVGRGNAGARSAARNIALGCSAADLARGVIAFHSRMDRQHQLAAFSCPVTFVTGAEDIAPGPAASARQAALPRNGRLEIVRDCGHYVPMERPAELNAILRRVIAAAEVTDGGSGGPNC
ncbi:MAG: alpha/beta hydrolase [Rhizobium sp.]|nr:alpha/beta hydrolase [Rhizobium sp.]